MKTANVGIVFMMLLHLTGASVYADDVHLKSIVVVLGLIGANVCGRHAFKCGRHAFKVIDDYVNYSYPFGCMMRETLLKPTTEDEYREHQSGGCKASSSDDIEEERSRFESSANKMCIVTKINALLAFFNKKLNLDQNYQYLVKKGFIRPDPTASPPTHPQLLEKFERHVAGHMRFEDHFEIRDCLRLYVESISRSLIRGNKKHTQILLESAQKHFSDTELYAMACKLDSVDVVKKLLDDGAVDIDCDFNKNLPMFTDSCLASNKPGVRDQFPIEVGCKCQSGRVAKELLQRGADIGTTDIPRFRHPAPISGVLLNRGILPISQKLKRYLQGECVDLQGNEGEKQPLSREYLIYLEQKHPKALDSHYKWLTSVDAALDKAGLTQEDVRHTVLTMVNGLPSVGKEKIAALQSQEANDKVILGVY